MNAGAVVRTIRHQLALCVEPPAASTAIAMESCTVGTGGRVVVPHSRRMLLPAQQIARAEVAPAESWDILATLHVVVPGGRPAVKEDVPDTARILVRGRWVLHMTRLCLTPANRVVKCRSDLFRKS